MYHTSTYKLSKYPTWSTTSYADVRCTKDITYYLAITINISTTTTMNYENLFINDNNYHNYNNNYTN